MTLASALYFFVSRSLLNYLAIDVHTKCGSFSEFRLNLNGATEELRNFVTNIKSESVAVGVETFCFLVIGLIKSLVK